MIFRKYIYSIQNNRRDLRAIRRDLNLPQAASSNFGENETGSGRKYSDRSYPVYEDEVQFRISLNQTKF
jgi:hypothetical protein